jgi:uncharacterized membrane protein
MNRKIQGFAWLLIGLGAIIIIWFIIKSYNDEYSVGFATKTNYETTGQFGDFIGGFVGTLFSLSGTLLIFLSFWEQNKQNSREKFETSFFEMIRLHRENVSELRYIKSTKKKEYTYENRQVLRVIFQEFIECYRDVKKFSNSVNPDDYIKKDYQKKLTEIKNPINVKINIIELSIIDIAYNVVYFGLGTEGISVLRKRFESKYNNHYYFRLLYYLKMKPKRENKNRFKKWIELRGYELIKLIPLIEETYKIRTTPKNTENLSEFAKSLKLHKTYEKYYSGHQFRLGHYFRHLFQSFKYLHNAKDLNDDEKYTYAKMLRAQLSTYEQALLFINSISSLGMHWEYIPDVDNSSESHSLNLISNYNLIKNLPGDHIYGIKYKTYYKNVDFEVL